MGPYQVRRGSQEDFSGETEIETQGVNRNYFSRKGGKGQAQIEETTYAKALKQERVWYGQRTGQQGRRTKSECGVNMNLC